VLSAFCPGASWPVKRRGFTDKRIAGK